MPAVRKGESQKDYVSRAIPVIMKEGTAKDQKQAAAIAYSMYRQHKSKKRKPIKAKVLNDVGFALSFDCCISLAQNDSDVVSTDNPLVYWKEIAHVGTFFKEDQEIPITERHLDHWHKTFAEMSNDGIVVPVPVEHTKDPEKRRGHVLETARRENSRGLPALYAKIRFSDADAAKLRQSGTSIFVPKEAPNGYGKKYNIPIQHVAITDYPVIADLEPFTVALSLTKASELMKAQPQQQLQGTGLSNNALLADVNRRLIEAGQQAISLDFTSDQSAKDSKPPAAPGANKPPDQPAQQQAQPQGNPVTTLRDLASQIGIDPSITDQQQLIAAIAAVIAQLKARAQAPLPPQNMMQHPGMMQGARPPMMQGNMQQGPAMVPGNYGPPAMHTGRPPIAMAFDESKHKRGAKGTHEGGKFVSIHGIENPNSAGQGHDPSHSANSLHGVLGAHGYEYSHTTPITRQNGEVYKHHTYKKGEHNIGVEHGTNKWSGSKSSSGFRHTGSGGESLHKYLKNRRSKPSLKEAKAELHRRAQQEIADAGVRAAAYRASQPNVQMSLDDIPEEILMALSKKQMKKIVKTIKKGKGSGAADFNTKSHFGMKDTVSSEEDDTYKDDADAYDYEGDEDNDEYTFDGTGKPGLSFGGDIVALSGSGLNAVKNARQMQIDSLFASRCITAAVKKDMEAQYVQNEQAVAFSHVQDDGFDFVVKMAKSNGPVLPGGRSGPQLQNAAALSYGGGDTTANPLLADAERRATGKPNFN